MCGTLDIQVLSASLSEVEKMTLRNVSSIASVLADTATMVCVVYRAESRGSVLDAHTYDIDDVRS